MNSSQAAAPSVQEYSIRVPKNVKKSFHVMRFNSMSNIDFSKWSQVKMERENNIKEFKTYDEDQPKFGAGSEYGREAREEARRKKYGIITRKYKPEDQPWILKIGGKTGKKFKGIREGGVAENAAYYVFTHAADGGIEAYPLNEWYNFQAIQRYKALSAEEAEQEFGRRNKLMNYFSLMMKKRLKNDEEGEGEEGEEKQKKGRKSSEFKISEMDDWVDSDDDDSDSNDDDPDKKEKKEKAKAKKKKNGVEAKKKKKGSDESAVEESDDGDEEGRELDYISDSSDSESDNEAKANKQMKGVAEESALRRLLTSDEDEDEDEKKEEEKDGEKKDEAGKDADKTDGKDAKDSKKKKRKKKPVDKKKKDDDSSSDSSGDSSDSDADKSKDTGASSSNNPSPADKKPEPQAKKPRLEVQAPLLSYGGENGITEEAVRRYLMRKPMTTIELLQKFKNRKTGLSSDQLVNVMTQILKKINPVKQTIKNKMYLSIKPQPH